MPPPPPCPPGIVFAYITYSSTLGHCLDGNADRIDRIPTVNVTGTVQYNDMTINEYKQTNKISTGAVNLVTTDMFVHLHDKYQPDRELIFNPPATKNSGRHGAI